jgi:hypothetical protein
MYAFFTLPHSQYSYLQGIISHVVKSVFRNLVENSLRILSCASMQYSTSWILSLLFSYSNPNICSEKLCAVFVSRRS